MPNRHKPLTRSCRIALAAVAASALLLPACRRPLLSPAEQRTPFDRYDLLRNQHAEQFREDAFGQRQPNLRARLAPKE